MSDINKRSEDRVNDNIVVFLDSPKVSAGELVNTTAISMTSTLDVSGSGLKLITDTELVKNSIHQLIIEAGDQRFNLVGEVMWVETSDDGFLAGIKLLESAHTHFDSWQTFVNGSLDI